LQKREQEDALRVAQRAKRFGLPPKKGNASGNGEMGGEAAAAADTELSEEDKAKLAARAARFLVGGGASAATAPANQKRERPKGGVKVLSGLEGALKGGTRLGQGAADGPQAKRQAAA
jgi:hypothetical protein